MVCAPRFSVQGLSSEPFPVTPDDSGPLIIDQRSNLQISRSPEVAEAATHEGHCVSGAHGSDLLDL